MREKEFLPLVNDKLGIAELNPMQIKMMQSASVQQDIILLSPTGSGKTLAFILPLLKLLKPSTGRIQAIVIAPSRELVLQIAGIVRTIAAGFKTTVLYGGHKVEDEVNSLKAGADIIIATPGRLLDHINRRNIDVLPTRILVLDEFDKSLELGFEKEMKKITARLKLDTLAILLRNLAYEKGRHPRSIVFVNHRESAERTAAYLKSHGIPAVLYHGALDQRDRETAIALFNNGSRPVLVATDLAARGLDIEGVRNVIHYHQPLTSETYTHRNGRTARVDADGDVFVLVGPEENVKDYIDFDATYYLDPERQAPESRSFDTIYFSAGKKEKLSRGDIVGFLVKEGGLDAADIGKIDVYDHYALAAVESEKVSGTIANVKGKKIKGEKRIISLVG